jgi:putative tricarboxylic transport membrane protein
VPLAPIILGLILGPMAEQNIRRALLLSRGDWTPIVTQPISVVLALATLALIVWPLVKSRRGRARTRDGSTTPS